ncbi:MAG: hypothetical protein Q8O43_02995 [Dehalococcoidia bacterium]|nr:hypothetical protein [Dehalococcoidia bacterium]
MAIPDYLSGIRLFKDVEKYVSFGEHRTGSAGESAATEWIADELEKAGLKTSRQEITLRQFCIRESRLTIGNRSVQCFPWWFPHGTGPVPLSARLAHLDAGLEDLKNRIALVRQQGRWVSPRFRVEVEKMVRDIAETGARAVIFISESPSGELVAVNTGEHVEPWPVPVVLVGPKDEHVLVQAGREDTAVTLMVDGLVDPQTHSENIFGRWGDDKNIIVVSTPKSGWFTCGGERGPGIAIVLALARWVGQRQPQASYWLDFNTGHELHNLGTREFLREAAPEAGNVRFWLHLGANIATWRYEQTETGLRRFTDPAKYPVIVSHDEIMPLVKNAFSHIPEVKPRLGAGVGEFGPVVEAGYRGFGLYGGPYHYFHSPDDGPQGTAPELLEPVMLAVIEALANVEASTAE